MRFALNNNSRLGVGKGLRTYAQPPIGLFIPVVVHKLVNVEVPDEGVIGGYCTEFFRDCFSS